MCLILKMSVLKSKKKCFSKSFTHTYTMDRITGLFTPKYTQVIPRLVYTV